FVVSLEHVYAVVSDNRDGATETKAWRNSVGLSPSSFSGSITIAGGATLVSNWALASGTVTKNGLIGGAGSNRFDFTGATFTNNSTVEINDFRFLGNGTQTISGPGGLILNNSGVSIGGSSNVNNNSNHMINGNGAIGIAG